MRWERHSARNHNEPMHGDRRTRINIHGAKKLFTIISYFFYYHPVWIRKHRSRIDRGMISRDSGI
jgi:hypothetical protein